MRLLAGGGGRGRAGWAARPGIRTALSASVVAAAPESPSSPAAGPGASHVPRRTGAGGGAGRRSSSGRARGGHGPRPELDPYTASAADGQPRWRRSRSSGSRAAWSAVRRAGVGEADRLYSPLAGDVHASPEHPPRGEERPVHTPVVGVDSVGELPQRLTPLGHEMGSPHAAQPRRPHPFGGRGGRPAVGGNPRRSTTWAALPPWASPRPRDPAGHRDTPRGPQSRSGSLVLGDRDRSRLGGGVTGRMSGEVRPSTGAAVAAQAPEPEQPFAGAGLMAELMCVVD